MGLAEFYRWLLPEALRNTVRKSVKRIRNAAKLYSAYRYDMLRFSRNASPFRDFRHVQNRLAYTSMLAHSIEKGMSMPDPRSGFGIAKVQELAGILTELLEAQTRDSRVAHGIGVLRAWLDWNRLRHFEPPGELSQQIDKLQADYIASGQDAAAIKSGDNIRLTAEASSHGVQVWPDFPSLASSRHSIRNFSGTPVAVNQVMAAARTAQSTPTLCNRQSCHIHLFHNDELGRQLLSLQGGNRGFTECIPLFAVITSELFCFLDTDERNQCWVEGGMFAMTFVHALHALGLGTCCLNWAKSPDTDRSMHTLSGIPESERVVMLIAIGHVHPDCTVTDSPTRVSAEVIHTHWTPAS